MLDIVVITATCMANRFVSYGRPFTICPRVDSSYHVWTNVKVVKRGMVWGISEHSTHKDEVFSLSGVYILKKIKKNSKVKVDV